MVKTITCEICGFEGHVLQGHLRTEHHMGVEDYLAKYADASVLSDFAKKRLVELEKQSRNELIDFDIKNTFGLKLNGGSTAIKGYKHRHPRSPELDPDYNFRKDMLALMEKGGVRAS